MNLDDLIADAIKRKGVKAPKRAAATKAAVKKTAEELRFATLDRCVPESIHLRTISQTCVCGATYESVNTVPLVKCVGVNVTHFRPEEDLTEYADLPIFIEPTVIEIPYCGACLIPMGATLMEPVPAEDVVHITDRDFDDLYNTIYSTGTDTYNDEDKPSV